MLVRFVRPYLLWRFRAARLIERRGRSRCAVEFGFTMSLFVTGLAFPSGSLAEAHAKVCILAARRSWRCSAPRRWWPSPAAMTVDREAGSVGRCR
jgi:hypothetical protein